MATLVALGGAAVGAFFGAPNLGFAAGSLLGAMIFPSGQDQQGPRLTDLSVQSSAYGAPIPWGDGTVRIAGNVIWSTGIKEHSNTQSLGGGFKGGAFSGPTSTTYSYTCSWAVALAEGIASDAIQIYADKKLIFDKTSTSSNRMAGLRFRFYKGDRQQLPDRLIAADPRISAGMCPAYRGTCYIVFEDLPLENFGNHVPSIEVVLAFRSVGDLGMLHSTDIAGLSTQQDCLAVDFNRRLFYVSRGTGGSAALGVYNYDTDIEVRQQPRSNMGASGVGGDVNLRPDKVMRVAPDGFIYGTGGDSNSSPIICLDPESLVQVGRFGTFNNALLGIRPPSFGVDAGINMPQGLGFVSNYDPLTGSRQDYVVASQFGGGQLGVFRAHSVEYVGLLNIPSGKFDNLFGRRAGKGLGDLYACSKDGQILRLSVTSDARYLLPAGPNPEQQFGLSFADLGSIAPNAIDPTATSFDGADAFQFAGYDASDDSILGTVKVSDGTGGYFAFKWREDAGIVWSTRVNFNNSSNQARLGDGRWAYQVRAVARGSNSLAVIDTVAGVVAYESPFSYVPSNGVQVYDYESDSLLISDAEVANWTREFLNRGAGLATTVGAAVKLACGKVDLAPADLDTTALDDLSLAGYIIGRSVDGKGAILPLGQAYFFDGAEIDGKIKFVLRGGESAFTVAENDMALVDQELGRVVIEQRTADLELPASATATFSDGTKAYQQNSKTVQRIRSPRPSMRGSGNIAVNLPIVLSPDSGRQIAEKLLYAAYIERAAYQMRWSWKYLFADPTDVATVDLDDGTAFRFRIDKAGIGVDYQIAIDAKSQDTIAYVSGITAGTDLFIPQQVKRAGFTELMVLDVPLLRDIDDGGGASSIIYLAASSYNNSAWPGCQILRSTTPAANGDIVGTDIVPATWGSCASALPDNLEPWSWDTTTSLRVYLANQGSRLLSSMSDDDVFAGANAAAIVRADGYAEIIQFANVTLEDDGSYSLDRILRGRRGTDVFCGGHAIGDRFILLGDPDLQTAAVPTTDSGIARYWRGVGFGTKIEEAAVVTKATNALDLRPYMPRQVAAAGTGGGSPDIDLSWTRRDRLHANLFNSPAGVVPLSEASEDYELEIYDAPGGTLKRTVTGLSSPAYTYAHANIVSDLGSVPASLTLKLYQVSAVVGRGLSREITVGVS